jgi:hypothetical protein
MIVLMQLAAALSAAPVDTVPLPELAPRNVPVGVNRLWLGDTVPKPRRKSVELSEGYETRLRIHQIASYATIPLFAAQVIVGTNLYNADAHGTKRPEWAVNAHRPLAYALGGLFAVNSVTGTMNWWETRHQKEGRTWRTIHAALMLASDAGFAYTGAMGTDAKTSFRDRDRHRTWALASSSLALASYVMMLSPFRQE